MGDRIRKGCGLPAILWRRLRCSKGATFLEYAMLCALIGIGVAVAVALLGEELSALFNRIIGAIRGIEPG